MQEDPPHEGGRGLGQQLARLRIGVREEVRVRDPKDRRRRTAVEAVVVVDERAEQATVATEAVGGLQQRHEPRQIRPEAMPLVREHGHGAVAGEGALPGRAGRDELVRGGTGAGHEL